MSSNIGHYNSIRYIPLILWAEKSYFSVYYENYVLIDHAKERDMYAERHACLWTAR